MTKTPQYLGDLFEPEPIQWGLRGDPHLWRAMKKEFATTPRPPSIAELRTAIRSVFLEQTGQSIDTAQRIFVKRFDQGGMSSGWVSTEFWRDTALAMLGDRL